MGDTPKDAVRFTYTCSQCKTTSLGLGEQPSDDELLLCHGCGEPYGTFEELRKSMMERASSS